MDIQDASGMDQYMRMITMQKQVLRKASRFVGKKPVKREPRELKVQKFMFSLLQGHMRAFFNSHNVRTTIISETYPPSTQSLSTLSKIMINDLRLETHHRGRYLLVRAATPPDKVIAIMNIVEDEDGEVVLLQVYNQDESGDFNHVVPYGTVCVVKEPYFKTTGDGGDGLRVDHVSDIVFLNPLDARIPREWRRMDELERTAEE